MLVRDGEGRDIDADKQIERERECVRERWREERHRWRQTER